MKALLLCGLMYALVRPATPAHPLIGTQLYPFAGLEDQAPSDSASSLNSELSSALEMLNARGAAAVPLYLPFTARTPQNVSGLAPWRVRGWWAVDEGKLAAAALESSSASQGAHYEWAVWDGARSTLGTLDLEDKDDWKALLAVSSLRLPVKGLRVGKRPFPGVLSRSWLPTELGWGLANSHWGKYLRSMTDVRFAGRETIRGVDCARLAFDMGGSPGKSVFPWVLWIDDRSSFLVMRTVSYHLGDNLAPGEYLPLEGIDDLDLGGETWHATRCVEVLEWRDLECGVRIGTRGTVRNGIKSLRHLDVDIEVQVSDVICGDELDDTLFEVIRRGDAVVHDEAAPNAQSRVRKGK